MQRRGAILAQRGDVMRSAVALVGGESVHGEHRVPLSDQPIAFDFSDDRCGGNRGRERVTVNYRTLRMFTVESQSVYEQVVWSR